MWQKNKMQHSRHHHPHPPATRSYRLQDAQRSSFLPAADTICGYRATISAAPNICHAYALLRLHMIVCLWSWVVCAWQLRRQSPRAGMSYVAPVSNRTRTTVRVSIMIPVPVWYTRCRYWYMTITGGQIALPTVGTDPTQVNMCERFRSYRSHPGT